MLDMFAQPTHAPKLLLLSDCLRIERAGPHARMQARFVAATEATGAVASSKQIHHLHYVHYAPHVTRLSAEIRAHINQTHPKQPPPTRPTRRSRPQSETHTTA